MVTTDMITNSTPASFLKKGKGLVIVAHPDDETIWMGGTLLSFPQISWTIFSLCRASDADRAPKFYRVCETYDARAIITDLEDQGVSNIKQSVQWIKQLLLTRLSGARFDYLFSHASNGEYGHPRHKGVYRAVRELLQGRKLLTASWFTFAYLTLGRRKIPKPDISATYKLHLSPKILWKKRELINKNYGYSKESFEYLSCASVEAFNLNKWHEIPGAF